MSDSGRRKRSSSALAARREAAGRVRRQAEEQERATRERRARAQGILAEVLSVEARLGAVDDERRGLEKLRAEATVRLVEATSRSEAAGLLGVREDQLRRALLRPPKEAQP